MTNLTDGFSMLFPQLLGKCQGKTRKEGARPELFPIFVLFPCIFLCSMYFCVVLCIFCIVLCIFVLFHVLFVLCRSLYCLCVYVY